MGRSSIWDDQDHAHETTYSSATLRPSAVPLEREIWACSGYYGWPKEFRAPGLSMRVRFGDRATDGQSPALGAKISVDLEYLCDKFPVGNFPRQSWHTMKLLDVGDQAPPLYVAVQCKDMDHQVGFKRVIMQIPPHNSLGSLMRAIQLLCKYHPLPREGEDKQVHAEHGMKIEWHKYE